MHALTYFSPNNKNKPDFPWLADEIAEPRPDMNIKVAASTVSEKSTYILGQKRNASMYAKCLLYELCIALKKHAVIKKNSKMVLENVLCQFLNLLRRWLYRGFLNLM